MNNEINQERPHVTICVPAYNASRTISRTLESILSQDYPNYDVLVCDNLSSDDTARIVKTYERNGVRYFLNPVNEKWGENNWNHALSLAEGPLIALYHADDLYTSTMVRRQVEFLQKNHHASAVFTSSQRIDEQDRPIRLGNITLPHEYKGKDIFSFPDLFNAALKYGTITVVPTMMASKSVLNKVGNFNWQQFYTAADIDLYLRMAQVSHIGIIDEPLHRYRISPQQGTSVIDKSRTHLAHFFWVMDSWLAKPEVHQCTESSSQKIYEMYRAADHVVCAMNFLLQGNQNQAKLLLSKELKLSHVVTATQRPQKLKSLLSGIVFLWSIRLGLGTLSGRCIYKLQRLNMQRKFKPLK